MKKLTLAAVLCLVTAGSAFADDNSESEHSKGGIFVEPAVTYELGDTKISYPAPFSDSTGHVKGWGLAARGGFHINDMFFAGVEARYSRPRYTDSAFGYDANAAAYQWAPVVGIQTPAVGLRVWGAWILGGELDPDSSSNYNVKFTEAQGYRVGVGFRVAVVSLNVEYQHLKYGKATLEQIGTFPVNTDFASVKPQDDAWIASVSFPIDM